MLRPRRLPLVLALAALSGCGPSAPVRADSTGALAADLRRAAEATDSGAPDSAQNGAVNGVPGSRPTAAVDSGWVLGTTGVPRRVPRAATAAPPAASTAASPDTSAVPAVTAPGPGDTSWCASPLLADQQRCLRVYLTAYDARLNGTYQSLIAALRQQAGARPGAPDPAPVRRLRTSQRRWLVQRDAECQRRGRGTEGALWAPARARCLGDEASRREAELLAELRADTGAAR